jgi:uncharacterized membrane protein HdeD (DUF308 family)
MTFAWPGLTLATLVILFATYAFIDGVFTLIKAFSNWSEIDNRWLLLLEALLGIIVGVLTWRAPGITAATLLIYIAVWSLVTGAFRIATAIRLRKEIDGEWMLALSGVISILFGLSLLYNPAAGTLGLLWLIGTFAIAFGILLVLVSFKIKGAAKTIRSTVDNIRSKSAGYGA